MFVTYTTKLTSKHGDISDQAVTLYNTCRRIKRTHPIQLIVYYVNTAGCAINELNFFVQVEDFDISREALQEYFSKAIDNPTLELKETGRD